MKKAELDDISDILSRVKTIDVCGDKYVAVEAYLSLLISKKNMHADMLSQIIDLKNSLASMML